MLNAQVIDITPLSSSLDELDTLRPESNMDDLLDDLLDDDEEQLDNDLSLGQVEDDDDILD